jgi:hypothetical protein
VAAIPQSSMPGHARLNQRALGALDLCQEAQGVEFKESGAWEALKWKVIATCMGMANLRDGGLILVGVSQRGGTWDLAGIAPEHLATFDPDIVLGQLNSFASPPIELDVVTVEYGSGRIFLAIQVREFQTTPVVCRKNGPNEQSLREGAIFVRPSGVPRTTKATDASDIHDLLMLAAEKRAREILEQGQRVGLVPRTTDSQMFDRELGGL